MKAEMAEHIRYDSAELGLSLLDAGTIHKTVSRFHERQAALRTFLTITELPVQNVKGTKIYVGLNSRNAYSHHKIATR